MTICQPVQILAFPTARHLAAALTRMHKGAEALKGTESGAAAGVGPTAARVGDVDVDLGGQKVMNSDAAAAGRPPVPGASQGAAAAPSSMPLLMLPGRSARDLAEAAQESGAHAAFSALQPAPPPVPALGSVVLQGGGVTLVRQGTAACVHPCTLAPAAAASIPASPGAEHAQPPAHELAPQQPNPRGSPAHAAAALAAKGEPAKHGQADRTPGSGSKAGMQPLRCAWRVRLSECVDAAPVIIAQLRLHGGPGHLTPASKPTRVPEAGPGWGCYALACSHGGDVVCVEGTQGALVWRATLPGRADAGLAVTADMQACVGEHACASGVAGTQRCQLPAGGCCRM